MALDSYKFCDCTEWNVCNHCDIKLQKSLFIVGRRLSNSIDEQILKAILEDPSLIQIRVPRIVKVAKEINDEQVTDIRSDPTIPNNK